MYHLIKRLERMILQVTILIYRHRVEEITVKDVGWHVGFILKMIIVRIQQRMACDNYYLQ